MCYSYFKLNKGEIIMSDNFENKNVFPNAENGSFEVEIEDIQNENQQSFFDSSFSPDGEDTTYRYKKEEIYPMIVSSFKQNVRKHKKEKKAPKTWLVSAVSAIIGAMVFAFVSPLLSGLTNGGKGQQFSFGTPGAVQSEINTQQVTYDKDNRAVLSTVDIGKMVGPSVVGIVSTMQYQGFFSQEVAAGSGSGIIFTKDGYIVTNYHVIEGATSVKVVLNTGDEYEAKLIGGDEKTDLAVIKVEATDLPAAVFGQSENLEAGEKVVAIGNPLGLEFAGTLTQGIISAVNRTVTVDKRTYKMIQTDAAINPGNSGGALVNEYGEVIGINSVKVSSSGVEGLGFAIPISDAKPIIEDLINFGYVKGRPLIGLSVRYVSEQEAYYYNFPSKGLFIVEVTEGTGAAKAGLMKGDIILSCDGKEVESSEALNEIRDSHKAGETIKLKINRNGTVMDVSVVLGEDTTRAQ